MVDELNKNKKIIIFRNNGGRLANQLWSFSCLYALALEKGFILENYSFFEYNHYFNIKISNSLINRFFFKPADYFNYRFKGKKRKFLVKIIKLFYQIPVTFIKVANRNRVVADKEEIVLPPTAELSPKYSAIFYQDNGRNVYVSNWNFSNPLGLVRYRKEIRQFFLPQEKYIFSAKNFIFQLREKFSFVVGIHIRHGDYKNWQGGKYYFDFGEVRGIMDDYLKNKNLSPDQVVFFICSDDVVDVEPFRGLNCRISHGTEIADLFGLSLTDTVIGSNSTYGAWAAYYGQIPFFIFSHEAIDWSRPKNYELINL